MEHEIELGRLAEELAHRPAASRVRGAKSTARLLVSKWTKEAVYDVIPRTARREYGVFFSGRSWARLLASQIQVDAWQRYIDPHVGIGDLLLEVCKSLPLERTVKRTLTSWSNRLLAIDLRPSFLRIAWARMQALALLRHRGDGMKSEDVHLLERRLPRGFRVANLMTTGLQLRPRDCVLMNPPYQLAQSPVGSFVGTGLRSAAALHLERVLTNCPDGVAIVALVPDVLRSGTSYKNFRKELARRLRIKRFEGFGRFDASADVDVAMLVGTTRNVPERSKLSPRRARTNNSVGSKFTVSVGPVVPHRTPLDGISRPYLTTANAPTWREVRRINVQANYNCRAIPGPFVLVRRTSSPSDKQRARATLIHSHQEILVENHLVVCTPIDGSISTCRALMKVLSHQKTSNWLNKKIRCRHLTTEVIASIPWPKT
jgi:hypothetical protein